MGKLCVAFFLHKCWVYVDWLNIVFLGVQSNHGSILFIYIAICNCHTTLPGRALAQTVWATGRSDTGTCWPNPLYSPAGCQVGMHLHISKREKERQMERKEPGGRLFWGLLERSGWLCVLSSASGAMHWGLFNTFLAKEVLSELIWFWW